MYNLIREKNIIRCNITCAICNSPFEFIEDENGDAIVTRINECNNTTESIEFDLNAKCGICGYRTKYHGKLNMR